MPIVIAAVPLAASTSNLPGSETTVLSLSSFASTLYGFITLVDKQSISTLVPESELESELPTMISLTHYGSSFLFDHWHRMVPFETGRRTVGPLRLWPIDLFPLMADGGLSINLHYNMPHAIILTAINKSAADISDRHTRAVVTHITIIIQMGYKCVRVRYQLHVSGLRGDSCEPLKRI